VKDVEEALIDTAKEVRKGQRGIMEGVGKGRRWRMDGGKWRSMKKFRKEKDAEEKKGRMKRVPAGIG
jgi:hypothetical protein